MRRGFTFFEVSIALLTLTVAGMITIPRIVMRGRETREVRAIEVLQRIAAAEHAVRQGKPAGSPYVFLPDLLARGDPEILRGVRFDPPVPADFARAGDFYFAVLLPDSEGRPVAWSSRQEVDPTLSALAFLVLAWPVERNGSESRRYAINHDLLVWELWSDQPVGGARLPRFPLGRLVRPGAALPPPGALPAPWNLLVPGPTTRRMQELLESADLPSPPTLRYFLE